MSPAAALQSVSDYCARHITPHEAWLMARLCELRSFPWLTAFFRLASRLGDGPLWLAVAAVLLAVGGAHSRWSVAVAALAIAVSILLFTTVKHRIGRPRPFETWRHLSCLMAPPDRFSFPSGHTMTAFAAASVFAEMVPGLGFLYLPAVAIGLSRVYLGCHYPTDVLVGGLLGTGIGWGMVGLFHALPLA